MMQCSLIDILISYFLLLNANSTSIFHIKNLIFFYVYKLRNSAMNVNTIALYKHFQKQQDTVTGFLLAGVGHRTADSTNFLIVKQDTKLSQVEEAFLNFSQRDDVGIILINQHIANDIRHVLKDYNQTIPTVLEIPSKEHPYDPEQDYIMQRVNMYLGGGN